MSWPTQGMPRLLNMEQRSRPAQEQFLLSLQVAHSKGKFAPATFHRSLWSEASLIPLTH